MTYFSLCTDYFVWVTCTEIKWRESTVNLIVITAFHLIFFILSWSHFIYLNQEGSLFFIDCLLCPQIASFSLLAGSGADTQVVSAAVCSRSVVFFAGWTVILAARRRCFLVLCHTVLTWPHMQIQYDWYRFRPTVALKHLFFLKTNLDVTPQVRKILFLQGLCKCNSSKIYSDRQIMARTLGFIKIHVTKQLDLLQIFFLSTLSQMFPTMFKTVEILDYR